MPILEDDDMDDAAVLWECDGEGLDGLPVYLEPVEIFIDFRIKSSSRTGSDGTVMSLDASATVPEPIPEDSQIWVAPLQGYGAPAALDQWYDVGTSSASRREDVLLVKANRETWDAKKREKRYVVDMVWDRVRPD